jgi:hypothetical protein
MDVIKTPLISIITVSYNSVKVIEQTISNVVMQKFNDVEQDVLARLKQLSGLVKTM